MGRALPTIINIIDLESTCYYEKKPEDFQDIIEIGICTLDISEDDPIVGEKRSILVKPARSKINEFCTKLTTITQEMVDAEGIELADAFEILRKEYKAKDRVWGSWGDFDRNLFLKQAVDYKLRYPFGPRHTNFKCLYTMMNHLPYELGMASALERCGLPLEGTHHRGHDDAQNIAKIARLMLRKASHETQGRATPASG